jgi:hypothetical protein
MDKGGMVKLDAFLDGGGSAAISTAFHVICHGSSRLAVSPTANTSLSMRRGPDSMVVWLPMDKE